MKHTLYTDADNDRPDVICDRNGQVVLDLCKVCGKAEAELLDRPECPGAPCGFCAGGGTVADETGVAEMCGGCMGTGEDADAAGVGEVPRG